MNTRRRLITMDAKTTMITKKDPSGKCFAGFVSFETFAGVLLREQLLIRTARGHVRPGEPIVVRFAHFEVEASDTGGAMVTLQSGAGIALALLTTAAGGSLAYAQPSLRPYVGASAGSLSVSADEVDGRTAAPGLLAGIAVSRFMDVEIDAQFPTGTITRSYSGISTSFAPPGSSRDEIERLGVVTRFDKQRHISANLSVVAILHPSGNARLTPGLVAGVANQRVRDRTVYTPVSIPPGVDPAHPSVSGREERSTRNIGGPTIGGNLAIRLTPHLFVVPDVRYDYGSIGDEINNALRTSVRVYWRF
jgi:hypothetical protein